MPAGQGIHRYQHRNDLQMPHRSYLSVFRVAVAAVLAAAAVAVVMFTYRWPLIGDAQTFHYIHLLTERGFLPYRDIPDINMPGCYVMEDWALRLFGTSDLSWRIYEFTLFGVLTLAMIVIARPYDWIAGLFASMIFILEHVVYGAWYAVERDEIMAVLIIVGYAFLFESLRRGKPWLSFGFGLSLGLAAALKPTAAPLFVALLVMAVLYLKGKRLPIASYSVWSVAGATAVFGYVLLFLLRRHVIGDFLYDVRTYTSLYAAMDRAPVLRLLRIALPFWVWVIGLLAIIAAALRREWKNWELWAIGAGIAFGVFSYLAQGKGFRHHAYPLMVLCLLWASIELVIAMHDSGLWTRSVGIAGVAAGIFIVVPISLHRLRLEVPSNDFTLSLESDLTHMGGPALNRRIECLDTVYGCFSALYHLNLAQYDGNVGDLLLFTPHKSPVIDQYRAEFLRNLASDPPAVIVLSNMRFYRTSSFSKLDEWPRFAEFLASHYRLTITRQFPDQLSSAYRIYVRNGASLTHPGGSIAAN
jgi:hypothetical protein